jgi:hypothetical protein
MRRPPNISLHVYKKGRGKLTFEKSKAGVKRETLITFNFL